MIKLLIIGIRMDRGGTEKALLSFLNGLPPSMVHVDLLLAIQDGPLLEEIPPYVHLLPPMKNGILFSWSRQNALSVYRQLSFRGKNTFFSRHADLVYQTMRGVNGAGDRLFATLMNEACLLFSEEYPERTYDAALAFSGDRTMFYLCDKVCCHTKIAWLHFDYRFPRRDDILYESYFRQCRGILSVSNACSDLLKHQFPHLADRFITFYNSIPLDNIVSLSQECISFPDSSFQGFRVLSVMRICYQKGVDRIPFILKRCLEAGWPLRWYIVGDGHPKEIRKLYRMAVRCGVQDQLILLGGLQNPYPLMKACDLFVLPSRFEGMPITVEEAKLLAAPILCTNYLSAKEQLENGRLGMICEESVDAITSSIQFLLKNAEARREYRNRLSCLSHKTDRIANKFLALLANVKKM